MDTQRELFYENLKLLSLGRQIRLKILGAFGVFWADLSPPILMCVPCPCFPLINHYLYKKLSLYIQIPKIYFGVGVEFGPKRIGNLVIACPLSVYQKAKSWNSAASLGRVEFSHRLQLNRAMIIRAIIVWSNHI